MGQPSCYQTGAWLDLEEQKEQLWCPGPSWGITQIGGSASSCWDIKPCLWGADDRAPPRACCVRSCKTDGRLNTSPGFYLRKAWSPESAFGSSSHEPRVITEKYKRAHEKWLEMPQGTWYRRDSCVQQVSHRNILLSLLSFDVISSTIMQEQGVCLSAVPLCNITARRKTAWDVLKWSHN